MTELMARYCDGDVTAFNALYRELAPRIMAYLMHLSRDRVLAEDLLQQTFLKLHNARSSYVRGADPVPWVATIARRCFVDEKRRERRLRDVRTPALACEVERDPLLAERLRSAIARLSEPHRRAFLLMKVEGKSAAAAGNAEAASQGAMKLRLLRACRVLRPMFEAHFP